jgi:hypothetical protein
VPVGDHEVGVAVVVEVEEGAAPLKGVVGHRLESLRAADVVEQELPFVVVERRRVLGEGGEEDLLQAVPVQVGRVDPHAGLGHAVPAQPRAAPGPDLGERAVPVVAVEEVGVGVVGDEDVDVVVVVEV